MWSTGRFQYGDTIMETFSIDRKSHPGLGWSSLLCLRFQHVRSAGATERKIDIVTFFYRMNYLSMSHLFIDQRSVLSCNIGLARKTFLLKRICYKKKRKNLKTAEKRAWKKNTST